MGFALGLAHDPCTGVDSPGGGANSPCTRTSDCASGLSCDGGVCTPLDAGPSEGGADAPPDATEVDATEVDATEDARKQGADAHGG